MTRVFALIASAFLLGLLSARDAAGQDPRVLTIEGQCFAAESLGARLAAEGRARIGAGVQQGALGV